MYQVSPCTIVTRNAVLRWPGVAQNASLNLYYGGHTPSPPTLLKWGQRPQLDFYLSLAPPTPTFSYLPNPLTCGLVVCAVY